MTCGDLKTAARYWRTLEQPYELSLCGENAPQAATQPQPLPGLTPRELEVLRLVAEGRSNRQIATELFISVNTAGGLRQSS